MDHLALLVLAVGVHFLLKILPVTQSGLVKGLYVLLVALEVVEGDLYAFLKVWVVESELKRI